MRVVVVAHLVLRRAFAYEWLIGAWRRRRPGDPTWSAAFAPVYVFVLWLPLLAVLFATQAAAPGNGAWRVLLVLPAYRIADIANFYVGLFFDRRQTLLAGLERSLLCLAGNFLELALALAVLLEASTPDSRSAAWVDALSVVTFVALPARVGTWPVLIETVGSLVALVLVAGGVAMLVGAIGQKFAVGDHVGPGGL